MTVSSTLNRVSTDGNNATTTFPVTFPFHNQADLVVLSTVIATGVQTVKQLTTDYTISGVLDPNHGYSDGGSVEFLVAPASTVRITIYRDPARTQLLDLVENDNLPAESVEAQFDYVTMLIQRVSELIGRSLRQPDGDATTIDQLPSAVARASKYLLFDSSGNPTATAVVTPGTLTVSAFIETLLDDANAATARSTLGVPAASGGTLDQPILNNPEIYSGYVFGTLDLTECGQLEFPAVQIPSADAHTLDDYEEGTWTPSIGGSATYTSRTGTYIKIGKSVTVQCTMVINALGTGSTSVIAGLPFTISGTAFGPVVWALAAASYTSMTINALAGTTTAQLNGPAAANASNPVAVAMGNGTTIQFTLSYTATA